VVRRVALGPIVAISVVLVLVTGAAGSDAAAPARRGVDTVVRVAKVTPSSFKGRGPYGVGVVTVKVPVPSEGYSTVAEVWYPAARSKTPDAIYNTGSWFPAPLLALLRAKPKLMATANASSGGVRGATAASGRFPLVLFSHGWAGFRDQSSFLTAQLASWGFVVAAPDHPSRDLTEVIGSYLSVPPPTSDPRADVQDLLATLRVLQGPLATPLAGHLDATRFVVIGHSAGAAAAEELSSLETVASPSPSKNPDLGFIALAGASTAGLSPPLPAPYGVVPSEPSIFVTAQRDAIVPAFFMKASYNAMTSRHRFVSLASSGHLVFADTCSTVHGTGVLVALFNGLKIPLPAAFRSTASDGCHTPDLPVTRLWPVIDQLCVAGARWMYGIDTTTAGLDRLSSPFGRLVAADTTGPVS